MHFKDSNNKLYWLDTGEDAGKWLSADCVAISDAEANAIRLANNSPPIPTTITMRQARLALLGAGLLAQVNTAVAGMTGAGSDAARIEWEFASTVERNKPLVARLSAALGLTGAQLDALFTSASNL